MPGGDTDTEPQIVPAALPLVGQPLGVIPHRQAEDHGATLGVLARDGVVEEHHHPVTDPVRVSLDRCEERAQVVRRPCRQLGAVTSRRTRRCCRDPLIVGEDRWRELWRHRIDHARFAPADCPEHQRRDTFWKQGSVAEDYDAIEVPVLSVSGWADGYTDAVFDLVEHVDVCRGIVGPWDHKYPNDGVPGPTIGFLQEGVYVLDDIGTEQSFTRVRSSSIVDGDPLSAQASVVCSATYRRDDWDVRVDSHIEMCCDHDSFTLTASLIAHDAGEVFAERTFERRIARDHL